MRYLLESQQEGQRLVKQATASPSLERLIAAGLDAGMHVLDAGCGAGATVPQILSIVGEKGKVTGIDGSPDRIAEARRSLGERSEFSVAVLPRTGLPAAHFDFTWSQFVFEYLADPAPALDELIRVTKPGGRVVVADVDRVGLDFWPVSPTLKKGLPLFVEGVARSGFDVDVGRKMYALFRKHELEDIRVHSSMHYLVAGNADSGLLDDWRLRFQVLASVVAPAFGSPGAYAGFCEEYLAMLADPDTLKFVLVLTTSGTRRPAP